MVRSALLCTSLSSLVQNMRYSAICSQNAVFWAFSCNFTMWTFFNGFFQHGTKKWTKHDAWYICIGVSFSRTEGYSLSWKLEISLVVKQGTIPNSCIPGQWSQHYIFSCFHLTVQCSGRSRFGSLRCSCQVLFHEHTITFPYIDLFQWLTHIYFYFYHWSC